MKLEPIRILIVEDQLLLARTLEAWITRHPGFVLAGSANDGKSGLDLCLSTKPDIALMDIDLPVMDGLELARQLSTLLPSTRLLTMSGSTDAHTIWRVSQCPVHGHVDKTMDPELLIDAIRLVAGGGTYFSQSFHEVRENHLSQPTSFQKLLSMRQQEVLKGVVAGWSDAQIAAHMGISLATVAVHRKHIRAKLGLSSDRELVAYGRRWGIR